MGEIERQGVTSADKRVAPLRQQTSLPREAIVEHMVDQFRRRFGLEADALDANEIAEAEERVRERFGTRAWTHYLP